MSYPLDPLGMWKVTILSPMGMRMTLPPCTLTLNCMLPLAEVTGSRGWGNTHMWSYQDR